VPQVLSWLLGCEYSALIKAARNPEQKGGQGNEGLKSPKTAERSRKDAAMQRKE
jgi:hypothetical protein